MARVAKKRMHDHTEVAAYRPELTSRVDRGTIIKLGQARQPFKVLHVGKVERSTAHQGFHSGIGRGDMANMMCCRKGVGSYEGPDRTVVIDADVGLLRKINGSTCGTMRVAVENALCAFGGCNVASATELTLAAAVGDGGNAYNLTKEGDGTLKLSVTNTFTGDLVLNGGTLMLGTNNAINTTDVDVFLSNGAKLSLDTYSQTLKSLTLTGNGIIDMGTGSSTLTLGDLTLGSNSLHVWNWTGNPWDAGGDQKIIVSGTLNGDTNTLGHFENVFFYSDSGSTLWSNSPGVWGGGTLITGNELTPPVPEASTWIAIIGMVSIALLKERKRLKAIGFKLKRKSSTSC